MHPNLRLLIDQAQAATPRSEQERLIYQWLPLIDHVADKLGLDPLTDDQLTAGIDALMHAAELFDPGRGVKFNTYAYTSIWRAMVRSGTRKKKAIVTSPWDPPPSQCYHKEPLIRPECSYLPADTLVELETRRRQCQRVRRLLARMRPRDREVVLAVVVGCKTKLQVGQEMGIGKERVRQLYERGIREARANSRLPQRLTAESVA